MRRNVSLLILLAVLVVGGSVAAGFHLQRSMTHDEPALPLAPPTNISRPASPDPSPVLPRSSPPVEQPALALEHEPPNEVAAQLEGARAAIRKAARQCLANRTTKPPPSVVDESAQEVSFRFRVTTHGQLAGISEVERLESRIADPALERCILETADAVTFSLAEAIEDATLTATLAIYVGELLARDPEAGPPAPPVPAPTGPPTFAPPP